MWKGGSNNEDIDLRLAVVAAVEEADRRRHRSVAVPAVSCGQYGFPAERGAHVILTALRQTLSTCRSVTEVSVVSGSSVIQSFHETLATTCGPTSVRRVRDVSQPDDVGQYIVRILISTDTKARLPLAELTARVNGPS